MAAEFAARTSEFRIIGHAHAQAEADHRIFNSLAMIAGLVRVRARGAPDAADAAAFLLEVADRIDTVAKLHRYIAHSRTDTVTLQEYLEEICTRQGHALARHSATFAIDCPPTVIVPFNIALALGLITAELFSNSLKYAHPAGLPVKASLACVEAGANALRFTYEDDGVGFPEAFDTTHDGHLGMRFIRLLSEQLGGMPNWLSDPLGIRFDMTVPLHDVDIAALG
jgi:two-component sensor histidine kinase